MADTNFNVNCGFFDSINGDRKYSASEMNRPYKRLISNGVFATASGTPSTDLQVLSNSSGMSITIKKGEGLFSGMWFESPSDIIMNVPSNTGTAPRRDSVIVQVDKRSSGRIGRIVYRTGIPSESPQPPDIGTVTNVIEYRISNIYVAASATYIGQDAIVDLRGSSECPWVTSLIQQVDTSTLFTQWQSAYQNYYNTSTTTFNSWMTTEKDRFEAWRRELTEELRVNANLLLLESVYTTEASTSEIPINITTYNKATDALMVFVNGAKVFEGSYYTIAADSSKIILTSPLAANQKVEFTVMKSVVDADEQTAMELMTEISDRLTVINQQQATINTQITSLTQDSGWINFSLESGVQAYSDTMKPAVRRYGNRTNLRGAIKNITAAGTTICTIPAAYCPAMNHIYTTNALSNSNAFKATVTLQIQTNGQVKLLATSTTLAATDYISIATDYIIG